MDRTAGVSTRVHGRLDRDAERRERPERTEEMPAVAPGEREARPERPLRRLAVLAGSAVLVLGALIGYALTRSTPWHRTGPPATVSGWAPYWQTDSALSSFTANRNVFTNLSLFAYHATAADSVTAFDGLGDGVLARYRTAADDAHVKLTASIIDDMPSGGMAGVLADPATRALHVRTIVQFAKDNRFDGIDLDYEKFAFSDARSTWTTTRPNWVAFVDELASALHHDGKTLTVSAPPSGDYWVYDYASIGKVVDGIRIMAYDYSTSEAGPIAPIAWVTDIVDSAKKLVPADKLILGVPVYGYDWPTDVAGVCPGAEADQPKRSNVSSKNAEALASAHGVVSTWDPTNQERTFAYTEQLSGNDANGAATSCTVTHRVWYSDAEAVHDRAYVAERQDLAGISLWSLGSDAPQVWDGIAAARANTKVWPPVTNASASSVAGSVVASVAASG
ncbi:MAG: putative glycosidase [Ilumatobacteraceae bacterium]|nr:putative glycosidase [Ilumatobacteraceae bacterium]